MKKNKIILLILCILLLTGCGQVDEMVDKTGNIFSYYADYIEKTSDNPMSGMNKDERILFVMHEMYPEHQFNLIESEGDTALLEDETGLQFKVDRIDQLASNQIMMRDDYMYEVLLQNNFLNEMEKVLNNYGYKMEWDEGNRSAGFNVDIINDNMDSKQLLSMIKEILSYGTMVPSNVWYEWGGIEQQDFLQVLLITIAFHPCQESMFGCSWME